MEDFFENEEYDWVQGGAMKETLLHKAMMYRMKHPEEWKTRQKEAKDDDSFIERYYAKANQVLKAKNFVRNLITHEVNI